MSLNVTDSGAFSQPEKTMKPSDEASLYDLRHELVKVRMTELSGEGNVPGAGDIDLYGAMISDQWLKLDKEAENLNASDTGHGDYWIDLLAALDSGYSEGFADPDRTVAAFGEVTGKILSFLSYHMYTISIRVLSGDRELLVRFGELILEILTGIRLGERPSSLVDDVKSSYLDYIAEDTDQICRIAESGDQNLRALMGRIFSPRLQSTFDHTEDSGLFLTRDYAGRLQQLMDQGRTDTGALSGFANVSLKRGEEKTGISAGLHIKASAVYLDDRQCEILEHSTDLCNLLRTGLL